MKTVVQKWGNSLGIRIPSLFVREFALKNGSPVEIIEEEGKIVILPKKLSLGELVSKITEENKHASIETGESAGNKEW